MPKMPCLTCGVPTNASRCPACQEKYLESKQSPARISAATRGYNKRWQAIRKTILDRDHWTCYRCNKRLIGTDATVDHLIPISKDKSLAYTPSNLAACCRSCNSRKKNN